MLHCCCSPNIYERQPRTPGWIVAAESGDVEWHRNEDLWLGWRLFQTSDKFYLNIHWHSGLRCWAGRQNFHNFPLLKLKQRSFDEVAILHNTRDETGLAAYLINAGTSILAQRLCCYTINVWQAYLYIISQTFDRSLENNWSDCWQCDTNMGIMFCMYRHDVVLSQIVFLFLLLEWNDLVIKVWT